MLAYGTTLLIGKQEEALKFISKKYPDTQPQYNPSRDAFYCYGDEGNFMWSKDRGSLIHEAVHLVFDALTCKGIPINEDNQEIFAYYLQWWIGRLSKEWSKS